MSIFRPYFFRAMCAGLLVALLQSQVSLAQTPSFSAPVNGFVYDGFGRSVRPIAGFVGSAVVGAPVLTGIEWVSLAANQKSAILQLNRSQLWIPDLNSPDQTQALSQIPSVQQAFWSSDSSRAILLAGSQLIWLTNFSSSPSVSTSWSLEQSSRPDRLRTTAWSILAADSAADNVLLTTQTSQGWQLWLASVAAAPVQIARFSNPVLAAFANTTATAFVLDPSSHQVLQLTGLSGTPALTSVLSSETYLTAPVAFALSTDDSGLFVADPRAKRIHVLSPSTGALLQDLPTSSSVASFTPLSPGLFVVNSVSRSAEPFWFLLTGQPGAGQPAKLSFVPRGQ